MMPEPLAGLSRPLWLPWPRIPLSCPPQPQALPALLPLPPAPWPWLMLPLCPAPHLLHFSPFPCPHGCCHLPKTLVAPERAVPLVFSHGFTRWNIFSTPCHVVTEMNFPRPELLEERPGFIPVGDEGRREAGEGRVEVSPLKLLS